MLKIRALTFALILLLGLPGVSQALSLGEIKIHSHFAQAFSAEISIPSYTSDELENLEVRLASADKFDTLGLDIMPYMQEFIFTIENKPNGVPFIKVITKQPLKELSISFVIEASWVGGKIIKDFHILLTPEAITELREDRQLQRQLSLVDAQKEPTIIEPLPQETSDQLIPSSITQAQTPSPTTSPETSERQARSSSKVKKFGANGLQYNNVSRGETLSQIAMKVRGDMDASMFQTMIALYEQNKQAFVNEDINKLKVGANLKLNDISDIREKSRREAFALAHQYMKGPTQRQAETFSDLADAGDSSDSFNPESQESSTNRLEISSASEEPVPLEILEKLKQEQIATTEEELTNARKITADLEAENQELRERIADLESRMDEISLKLFQDNADAIPLSAPEASSATQQEDNLVVTNSDIDVKKGNLTLLERIKENQQTLSIIAIIFLALVLIVVRKKEAIRDYFAHRKEKKEGPYETLEEKGL